MNSAFFFVYVRKKQYICRRKMEYRIFDDMARCTEAEEARLMGTVSEQRRQYALRYKHLFGRWATLKTYEMLMPMLDEAGCPNPRAEWQYTPEGKPYIKGGPFFSLSHCQKGLAVAVDSSPIGIDIEQIRSYSPSLAERTMNEQELAEITASDDPARAFIRLWTRKEAYLKWKGTGITEDLRECLSGAEQCKMMTIEEKDYVCTIAMNND